MLQLVPELNSSKKYYEVKVLLYEQSQLLSPTHVVMLPGTFKTIKQSKES